HRTLAWRERLERDEEREARTLGDTVALLRIRLRARERRERIVVRRFDRGRQPGPDVRAAPPPAQRVDAEVRDDAREPAPERCGRGGGRRGREPRERLLDGVFGVLGAAGQPIGEGPERAPLRLEQRS